MNKWDILIERIKYILTKSDYLISNLANVSSVIYELVDDINWVGFYLYVDNQLILGPFQGKSACTTIELGKGVCGTAAIKKETQFVPNVHEFPGHIACDVNSNSEIVVPIMHQNEIFGVLDIDSPTLNRFSIADKNYFEKIVNILEKKLDDIL